MISMYNVIWAVYLFISFLNSLVVHLSFPASHLLDGSCCSSASQLLFFQLPVSQFLSRVSTSCQFTAWVKFLCCHWSASSDCLHLRSSSSLHTQSCELITDAAQKGTSSLYKSIQSKICGIIVILENVRSNISKGQFVCFIYVLSAVVFLSRMMLNLNHPQRFVLCELNLKSLLCSGRSKQFPLGGDKH